MSRPKLVKEEAGLPLDRELLVRVHDLVVETRVLEERLVQMYKPGHGYFLIGGPGEEAFNVPPGPLVKKGHGYFWIGGPGEEAFNVPLGLLMKKGKGPAFDYLHGHYRQAGTLLALGEDPIGALRQMKNTATDPYSGGRNFSGHLTKREWNI